MGKFLDIIAPVAVGLIGTALGGPFLGAAAAGTYSGVKNHSLESGLLGGLGTFAGNALGSSFGSGLGTVGSSLGSGTANAIGEGAISPFAGGLFGSAGGDISSGITGLLGESGANAIGSSIANTSIGGALGSYAGNSLGSSIGAQPSAPSGPAPFQPTQSAQAALPSSLSSFSDQSPLQQSTNLATQGVYGGGLGPQEQQYFLNLENRKLVDQSGKTSDMSSLSPIEGSYLSKLGLGGRPDTSSLLQAISQWSPA